MLFVRIVYLHLRQHEGATGDMTGGPEVSGYIRPRREATQFSCLESSMKAGSVVAFSLLHKSLHALRTRTHTILLDASHQYNNN